MDQEGGFFVKNNAEPGVINHQMLVQLAIEQGAKGEAGKLFLQDGIKLEEIEEIRIEFLNILKIDNLWIMSDRLTRLKLSNNSIDKIENLDSLVNLCELDLSFNHIQIIENLDNLVKLEILLLYGNEIYDIGNGSIDRLIEMTILSLGANKIDTWDHVMYLRKFEKLRTLNVADNSCTTQDGYYDYLIGFLPQMKYLNYKMVSEDEREIAQEKHRREIINLEESEGIEKIAKEEKKAYDEKLALLSISYVEYLDGDELFELMYKQDKGGKDLSLINDETRDAYDEYKQIFTGLCHELYELGLRQQERRSEEKRLFEKIVDEGREAVYTEAREMMDEIIARNVEIFEQFEGLLKKNLKNTQEKTNYSSRQGIGNENYDNEDKEIEIAQQLADELNDLSTKTWNRLMHREVVLHEQIEDTNETFKLNMSDLVTASFLGPARGLFSQMRDAEADYKDNIDSLAMNYLNSFTDETGMPPRHIEICGDKDILTNTLATSHDLHLETIDSREDVLLSRIKKWYDDYMERLTREERERHRNQILEISHFFECQKEEFDALQFQFQTGIDPTGLDADMIAAMTEDL